uniref:Interleukin-1 n=1 Tax=Pogona vitticeps TaxID=103695 RepID=A0A6J0V510_9SAUR
MEKIDVPVMMKSKTNAAQKLADLFDHFEKPVIPVQEGLKKPWLFRIWDTNQKFFVLLNQTLVAAPQDSNSTKFEPALMAVVPNKATKQPDEQTYPIFLGLKDGNHVLSCIESGGQPQLQLAEENAMDLYNKNQEFKNFTFFCHTSESTCSFESSAFLNWYISASTEANKPIGLSHKGGREITTFYFEKEE